MSYRANPALDLQILHHRDRDTVRGSKRNDGEDASVLIDATMKEDFPPISLPQARVHERAEENLGGAGPAEAQAPSRRGSVYSARRHGRTSSSARRSAR